jgi:serine/threonine protein kinase
MAEVISGGEPVNDAERMVIRHLRDHGPADWVVLHNIELSLRDNRKYEIDVLVVTGHSVVLIDVKGTRGRIEVAGNRWYPTGRQSFRSPVGKLRDHARTLKGKIESYGLNRVYVDALVVLTAPDARLVDTNGRTGADAEDVVTGLDRLIPVLQDPGRVGASFVRDITPYRDQVLRAFTGTVQRRTEPVMFRHWAATEQLGETDEVTEYRARNSYAPDAPPVLLRVYHADSLQPADVRAAEGIAIANAYQMLVRLPRDPAIVGGLDFFPAEDESYYVLVLEDVSAQPLLLHLSNPQQALAMDVKLRVIKDMLRGLAVAHANRVLHRALSPTTVLVTGSGSGMLTGFDYARPEDPRANTVVTRLADAVDPLFVAPECQNRPQNMSRASDVYAAGVVAYYLLTGELPFASSTEQHDRGSELPSGPLAAAGISPPVTKLLRLMCASSQSARPTAAQALEQLSALGTAPAPAPVTQRPDYRNLPEGYQLTRKYTVQRRVGTGTFGAVYQVYDNLAGADRAVKIVDRDRESLIERLRQEYQVLLRLPPHPNVVRVESADYLDGDVPYLVFEYLDGQDVGDLVRDRVLGPADAVRLGVDVTKGLAFLHASGVFHCDIKPSNLLWTDRGCKIIDFNVAVLASSSMSRAGGSVRYAPPDVTRSAPPSAADLTDRDTYALGVTLYQVLTGRYPFGNGNPAPGQRAADPRIIPELTDLSDDMVATLLRAISPVRSERFGSAAEFQQALSAIGENVRRRPAPPPLPDARPPVPAPANVNPFVTHLQTLYSQSTVSNAGTRGEDAYGTYVATALDRHLIPDVLDGKFRLVIITGNAGDGKTAFLERLVRTALAGGGQPAQPRANGADVRLPRGQWLRTNNDGSQDEENRANDDVLTAFFSSFAEATLPADGEIRLIAINEGRLVDFLTTHEDRLGSLAALVRAALAGEPQADGDIAVVNLNQRSLVSEQDKEAGPIFDRILAQLTSGQHWATCDGCELVSTCYAPHNARTLAHPTAGPKVTRRLREIYRLAHLRGQLHITLRDLRSAIAFMLTSGRDCADIHQLYYDGNTAKILGSFYFNSWTGTPDTADRLLRTLSELDVAATAEPVLDRKLAFIGPAADQAMMTIDQRGDYDLRLLQALHARQSTDPATPPGESGAKSGYLASARRRFYFESLDDRRARSMLPYRSAERFLSWLASPGQLGQRLAEVVTAINRGEGLPEPTLADGALAIAIRDVPGGTIRSYRLFPASSLSLTLAGASGTRYVEGEPYGLELSATASGGNVARLAIRLDLFELLQHQGEGYLPSVAEQQGRYLDLAIFKNELTATPYQEVVLTTGGRDAHRIRREPSGQLVMTQLSGAEAGGRNGS